MNVTVGGVSVVFASNEVESNNNAFQKIALSNVSVTSSNPLLQFIIDVVDGSSGSNTSTQTLASATVGNFLTLSGVSLTFNMTQGASGWGGTVTITATGASLYSGMSFSASLTGFTGTYTLNANTQASSFSFHADTLSLTVGEALLVTANDITLNYDPSVTGSQTLVMGQSAMVSSPDFPAFPAVTLNNFDIRTDGFNFDSLILTDNNSLNFASNILSVSGFTLTIAGPSMGMPFNVTYGTATTPPSVSGSVSLMLSNVKLFPQGGFVTVGTTSVTGTYSFSNFDGTSPSGQLSLTVSGFTMSIGNAFLLTTNGDITVTPGQSVIATIASATISSPDFSGLGQATVTNFQLTQTGFTLGNLTLTSGSSPTFLGSILTFDSVSISFANFAFVYGGTINDSFTIPTNAPVTSVALTHNPTTGTPLSVTVNGTLLTLTTDYTVMTTTISNVTTTSIVFTHAQSGSVQVAYTTAASITGTVTVSAKNVVLFPSVSFLDIKLGNVAGSYTFDAPGDLSLTIPSFSFSIGEAITLSLGSVTITPDDATVLSATNVQVTSPLLAGFVGTINSLTITKTGLTISDAAISIGPVSIGNFLSFSSGMLEITGFSVDTSRNPVVMGSISISLNGFSLFPGDSIFSVTGSVMATFALGIVPQPWVA